MASKAAEKQKIVTIFGGTGFVGRYIVHDLAKTGAIIKVATRAPECGYFLKTYGDTGQIVPVACNYRDEKAVTDLVAGSDYVVNCIGILNQKRKKSTFQRIHQDLPEIIAKACKKHKIKRFVHISALGAENGVSKYACSKLAGEKLLSLIHI